MLYEENGIYTPMNIHNLYIKNNKKNEDDKDELIFYLFIYLI